MFFNAITFKDSATPFAEALVELHHEIMFYLIVIVSVVIFILINAINITRVRESYFYSQLFSFSAFLKSLLLNSLVLPLFNKFLYSSYYLDFSFWFSDKLLEFLYIFISKGGSYLSYFLNIMLFIKGFFLRFLAFFNLIEVSLAILFMLLSDYKLFKNRNLLLNAFVSNNFFYKTRNLSVYFDYISNLVSYLSILSLFNDLDYKNFFKNKNFYSSYFYNLSVTSINLNSARSITNSLDLNSLESLYALNNIPNINELNSHFFLFFSNFLKSKFSFGNSLNIVNNKLSYVSPSSYRSLYSFINAQTYTVHNTKLEII